MLHTHPQLHAEGRHPAPRRGKPRMKNKGRGKPIVNRQWFLDCLREIETSQRQFAFKLGALLGRKIDPAAISLGLRGKRRWQMDEITGIAELFHKPVREVLENLGAAPPEQRDETVPIIGTIDDQGVVHYGRVPGPRRAPLPAQMPEGAVALRYEGLPAPVSGIEFGFNLYYVPRDGVSPQATEHLCIIRALGDDDDRVMWVRHGLEPGTHTCIAIGGGTAQQLKLAKANPVVIRMDPQLGG